MFFMYFAAGLDMGVGQPITLGDQAIWYYYANIRAVQ